MMQLDVAEAAVEVKLARQDSKPWGFRVTGGLDFGTPLTVLRLTAGSLAEMAGLKVGDILLTANGQPLSDFNHHESHKFLQEAGNSVDLLVVRGSMVLPPPLATPEEIAQAEAEAEAQAKAGAEAKVKAEEEARKAAIDPLTVLKPFPPPATPSVFETIFGPLEEFQIDQSKDEFEELVNELVHEEGGKDIEIPSDILVEESASAENEVPELSVTEQSTAPAAADMDSVKDSPVNTAAVVSDTVSAMATTENIGPEPVSLSQQEQEKKTVPITEEVRRDFTEEELEEELEEFMLGHAELLRGKALGVDFDKLVVSNNEVIEHSQVLKTLKEEQNQPEKKKFSTFLIRPNRPKIKPKEKPKPQENKKLLEIKSVNSANEKPKQTETKLESTVSTKDKQKPQEINQEITTEKPETKSVINTDQESTEVKEVILTPQESVENKEVEELDSQEKEQIGIQIGTAEEIVEVTTSETEGTEDKNEHLLAESIEERAKQQVYKVNETEKEPQDRLTVLQKQLAALLLLPAAMQQQLSLLQQEMSNIVVQKLAQLNKLAEHKENIEAPIAVLQVNVQGQDELHKNEEDKNKKSKHEDEENKIIEEAEVRSDSETREKVEHTEQGVADGSAKATEHQEHSTKASLSQESEATEITAENPSDEHMDEQMDENEKQHEEPKIKFHPKTPRPRPVMLPRRLRLQMFPESAYNEEFIAENLSGNAEIIMGNTIGVNFQKYTRNYDHLKSSSVLRMINESEGRRPSALPPPPKQLITPKIIKQKEEPVVTVESKPKEEPIIVLQDPNMNAESVPKESNLGAEPVDLDKPKPEEEPIALEESKQIPNAESVVSEEVAVEEAKGEPIVTEDSIQKEPPLPVKDSTVKEEINAASNSEEKQEPAALEAPKLKEELAAQESNPVADPIAIAIEEPTPVLKEEPAAQESNLVADPIAKAIEEPTPILKDEPTDNGEPKP